MTRIHSFVKYLPRFNYQPIVLTLKESYAYAHAIDHSLLEEYDPVVKIFRTGSLEPTGVVGGNIKNNLTGFIGKEKSVAGNLRKYLKSIIQLFLIPDEKILWLVPAVIKAWKITKELNIQIIFITSPPHSVSLIGCVIAKITGIPFVWDIRDDWVGNKYFAPSHWYRSKIESFMEAWTVSQAEMLIAVTEESKKFLVQKYPRDIDKIHFIPNGFDPEILEVNLLRSSQNKEICRFIYSGSLTWRRDLSVFFDVIAELNQNGELVNQISIDFVGSVHEKHIEYIEHLGIQNIVSTHGHLSHQESIRKLVDADVCILVSTPEEGSRTVIPSKIYEYLAFNKFIFTLAEANSAVAGLMKNQQFGMVMSPSDYQSIREGLESVIVAYRAGSLVVNIQDEYIDQYNRINLTEALAESFNQISV